MSRLILIPIILLTGLSFAAGCSDDGPIVQPSTNHSPILSVHNDTTVIVGDTLKLFFNATDIDDDSLTYWVTPLKRCSDFMSGYSPEAEIDPHTGYFWFIPSLNDLSVQIFMFTVIDYRGGWDFDSLIVTVNDPRVPQIELNELLTASTEVELNSYRLLGNASVWWWDDPNNRCFNGGYLYSCVQVFDLNAVSAPELELKYMWVVREQEIWALSISEDQIHILEDRLQACISHGPSWRPGSYVDVIIGFLDPNDPTEELILLRSPNELVVKRIE
jgi:hypothetical protein